MKEKQKKVELQRADDKKTTLNTILGTGIGNALEWFDWNVYAVCAVYISTQIFDKEDPASSFLATMAVFAVGFVARPFGGFVFGWLADRIGRKQSLTVAVICVSIGSFMVAICPPYAWAGWFASLFLLIARLIQGLAHGGELPSAQTYLAERAPREKRGLWASSIYMTGTAGILTGIILAFILETALSNTQMQVWGWRVPFAIGGVLGLFALWMRSRMVESEVFEADEEEVKSKGNVFVSVAKNWKTALKVIGMTCGLTVSYYIWAVVMPSAAQKQFGFAAKDAFLATIIANIVFILALPIWGAASDRIGRKPTMIVALLGNAVLYIPFVKWIESSHSLTILTLCVSIQLILLAGFLGHAPATYAEMFTTDQRASGFGIPYAIAIAAFGGTAGFVLAWMGDSVSFAIYSIILLVISAGTVMTLKETKGVHLEHEGALNL